jgi:hypothetical protein
MGNSETKFDTELQTNLLILTAENSNAPQKNNNLFQVLLTGTNMSTTLIAT